MEEQKDDGIWVNLHDLAVSPEFIERMKALAKLEGNFENANNYYQKLIALRQYYFSKEADIIANKYSWRSSYPVDWFKLFTPIEFRAWTAIKCKGKIVLYPQYPVLNFHIDFANPGLKIALELDGKQYHDLEKDKARDLKLKQQGWTIYRITGSEMMKENFKDWTDIYDMYYEDDDEKEPLLRDWILNTGDGVIEAIKEVHFMNGYERDGYLEERFRSFCYETLENHQII